MVNLARPSVLWPLASLSMARFTEPRAGIEPAASPLRGARSGHLSYQGIKRPASGVAPSAVLGTPPAPLPDPLRYLDSNQEKLRGQNPAGLPIPPYPAPRRGRYDEERASSRKWNR